MWCCVSILPKTQAQQKSNCIGPACTNTCTRIHRIRLGGSGGMLSRENFWIFDALRWFLSFFLFFFCLKTFTWTFWHGKITDLLHDHTHDVHWHWQFQVHLWTWQRSGTWKPVNIRATPIKNVWPPRSQSACSQVSAVLFHTWTAKFMWA